MKAQIILVGMKAQISFIGLVTILPLTLISCGERVETNAELANMLLVSNPFYDGGTATTAAATTATSGDDGGTIGGPGGSGGGDGGTLPNPSATPTPSPSTSPQPSASPSPTPTPSPSCTPTPNARPGECGYIPPSPTPQPSESPIPSPTASPSPSVTPHPTCSPNPSPDPNHRTEAGFVRVCSQMRSGIKDFIFFEEAKNPILTVEHVFTVTDPKTKKAVKETLVLEAREMYGMNLLTNPKPTLQLNIDLEALKQMYPKGAWATKTLNAYICEDKKRTGTCSNKTGYNVLSIGSTSFRADRVPKRLSFELWSGRKLLLKTDPKYCEKQYSPLVLDLAGDGIKLSGPGKGVRFDLDDTGVGVLTGWVDRADDVLLVRDLNRNSNIDSGAELFGSATRLQTGLRALNGFEALIDLDSNGDMKFDNHDSAWNEVHLWVDRNLDALTDSNELISLEAGGVISIDLNYVTKEDVDVYGNATKQRSTFIRRFRGRTRTQVIIDVWFNTLIPH